MIDQVVPAIAHGAAFVIRRHTLDLVGLCNGCSTPSGRRDSVAHREGLS